MSTRAPQPIMEGTGEPVAARSERMADSDLGHLRRVLVEIKKAIKQAAFNRHRSDQFESYMATAHGLLAAYLQVHKVCEFKLEVSTFVVGDTPLFEDDQQESNLIYPLWAAGIRLLTFKEGVTALELVRFFLAVVDYRRGEGKDDLVTHLWKQEFQGIEWVVVTDFDLGEEGEQSEVEIEVEKVLTFLQDSLRSDTNDGIGFARVSIADLDVRLEQLEAIRQTVVTQQTVDRADRKSVQQEVIADERDLLRRICNILLEVMKMPSTERELSDLEQALEQLLDGLILEGQFGMVDRLLDQCEMTSRDAALLSANRQMAKTCSDRLFLLMHEGQRVRAIGSALNSGRTKDLDGLKRYLMRLGPTVTLQLLDLLDTLTSVQHRRLVCDVMISVGQQGVPIFARRLPTASSNLAKDLLYIIDKVNPPDKVSLFAPILKHENAVLRMEGLTTIARTKDQRCFEIIEETFRTHEVPQMRAHAARLLAEYPSAMCEPVLLGAVSAEDFEEKPDGEKRALIGAVAKVESNKAQGWVRAIFAEKSGLLRGRKVDDRKLMAISALQAAPGLPALQLLVEVAKDERHHSKEVLEAAAAAALEVKRRMSGPGGVPQA
ncbi:MAG: hypothetical protein HYS27_10775 [Deltaproteobacteria bacterium]|nr:hypothetical protein [Deltaproteobacteria bacterium]